MHKQLAFPEAVARTPLFDRLDGPDGPAPVRMLDRHGLEHSVARELLRMLNRRAAPRLGAALSVPDYGLPDWSALSPANPDDRLRLARDVVRAVRAFEPRLRAPSAQVELSALGQQALAVRLAGRLGTSAQSWPVQFDLAFGPFGVSLAGPGER